MRTIEIICLIIGIAIYLNIGYLVKKYYREHVCINKNRELTTVLAKIAAGGLHLFKDDTQSHVYDWVFMYLLWPTHLMAVVLSWLVYLICNLIWLMCKIVWLIFRLTFALVFKGGIVKLLHLA